MSNKFEIVFRGKLAAGFELEQVKINLARMFKKQPSDMDRLFAGKRLVLRRGLDQAAANHYRQALKKAGAICIARAESIATFATMPGAKTEPVPTPPPSGSPEGRVDQGLSLAEARSVLPQPEKPQPANINTSGLHLDEVGAIIDETEVVAKYAMDEVIFSLDPLGAEFDKVPEHAPPVHDFEGLVAEQPGAPFEQPEKVPAVEFDLSGLITQTDDTPIDDSKKAHPAEIDTSGLALEKQ